MANSAKRYQPRAAKPRPTVDLRAGFRGEKRRQAKVRIYQRDEGVCQGCHQWCDITQSHLDHRVPISKGGGHHDGNLQTLCLKCSKAKTAREQC